MSQFVGCVDRIGAQERVLTRQMLASLARRPHVRSQIESVNLAAFGASSWDQAERAIGRSSTSLLVGDLRIDNRTELQRLLGCSAESSDADLVLLGIDRWGERFLDKLCGDFAFAIWDERRRTLFAARDPFGVKAFYYTKSESRGVVLFSNDVEPLVAYVDRRAIDPEMVADYLTTSFQHHRRTFFRDIVRLQAGHFLVVTENAASQHRYFFPPTHEIKFRETIECFAEFRRLLKLAIHDRLETRHPILARLSGGFDSTSIVLLADEIYEGDQAGRRPPLTTASAVFPGLPCDESEIIAATRARVRFPAETWVGYDARWENLRQPRVAWPGSPAAISGGSTGDLDIMSRLGAKVALSGTGGDELSYAAGIFRDLVVSRRWLTLLRETVGVSRFSVRQKWKFLRDGFVGLIPRRALIWRRRHAPIRHGAPPPWWGPILRNTWPGTNETWQTDDAQSLISNWTQYLTWNTLVTVTAGVHADYRAHYAAEAGIEMRFPFLDRRLVTFVLALGPQHRLTKGYMRRLQWEGLRDKIPNEVFQGRLGSAESARVEEGRRAAPLYREIIEDGTWCSGAWVDQGAARHLFRRTLNAAAFGADSVYDWMDLQRIATFEAWHRTVLGYNPPVLTEGQLCL